MKVAKAPRTDAVLKEICIKHQSGECSFGATCRFAHTKVTQAELERCKAMRSGKGDKGDPKGKGRGKGKGKGKEGKGKGKDTAEGKGGGKNDSKKKPNLYCASFLQTGTCKWNDQCPNPHMDAEEVTKLRSAYGDRFEKYFGAGKPATPAEAEA